MEAKLKSIVNTKFLATGFFLVLIVFLAYQKLAFYIRFDFNFMLLLFVLPFVVRQNSKEKSVRYGILALGLLLLYPFLKLSSIYFFAFICFLFFLYESKFGKLTSIPLFLVLIVSPVAIFLSEIIGFEIRLYLTKVAANILSIIDKAYIPTGNIITHGDQEFHVDPECMGLKMVLLSLFITLIFISYQQRKKNNEFHIISIIVSLVSVYILVILSNLFRIVLITLFKSFPGSFMHEFIGIICIVIYVVIPIWFIIKILPVKKQNSIRSDHNNIIKNSHFLILSIIITSLFSIYRFSSLGEKTLHTINLTSINIEMQNFNQTIEDHGVLKLSNDDILMYIKPPPSFYSADHSPIICWRGSGYKVQKEQIISIANNNVFFSELIQDNQTLYSTWWYDCGDDKTISQFRWRTQNMIANKAYRLVNVISHDKDVLYYQTEKLLTKNIFK